MPDFTTIDSICLDSWHILISGHFKHWYLLNISCSKIFDSCKIKRMVNNLTQFKHWYLLNISCSKIFDSCKIKRMVNNLTQMGYVNNYDKNR